MAMTMCVDFSVLHVCFLPGTFDERQRCTSFGVNDGQNV